MRPDRVELIEGDTYRAWWGDKSAVFTQTRERPYSGADDNFKWDEIHRAFYEQAVKLAPYDDSVTDFGCGSGYGTDILSETFRITTGVDASEEACKFAKLRAPHATIACEDLDEEDTWGLLVDVGVWIECIEHFKDPLGVLKRNPCKWIYMSTPDASKSTGSSPFHVKEFTREELMQLLENAGYECIKFHEPPRGFESSLVVTAILKGESE